MKKIIDGSIGGGSIFRIAAPLSITKKIPTTIKNIRSNRPSPGLRLQHQKGLEALSEVSGVSIRGLYLGSSNIEIDFENRGDPVSELTVNLDTAASVSLIFQILSNYAFSSNREFAFRFNGGGTHTSWSPNFDYLQFVTVPIFDMLGLKVTVLLDKHGFFPKGGAEGQINVQQVRPKINFGPPTSLEKIIIISKASNNLKESKVAERQIPNLHKLDVETRIKYVDSNSPGSSVTAILIFDNGIPQGISILGKKGLRAEKIAENLRKEIFQIVDSKSTVDQFMADQLMLPLALSAEDFEYTFSNTTEHIISNQKIINSLLGDRLQLSEGINEFVLKKL